MDRWLTIALTAALLTVGCVGALDGDDELEEATTLEDLTPITEVQDRHELNFTIDDGPSHTLEEGPYEILDGIGVHVNVPLEATEGAAAAAGMANVHMGIFLPDIPGCGYDSLDLGETVDLSAVEDLEANASSEGCQVPVVADIGPYYSSTGTPAPQLEGDSPATEPAERLGGFLIEQLVPHGYAVAQVSVFGTGDSGHCMDLMGDSEQAGIDGAVEFLGEAPFSNGNVGLTGRSYDGTTPWEAAATAEANDHLKTIAPISGLLGLRDLMWQNGSSESRGGTGLLYGLYYTFAIDGKADDLEHVACPDATLLGGPMSWAAYATGGDMGQADEAYWAERSDFFGKALENYDGSVYLIHGLQDWNVDPHMALPAFGQLQDAGIETKALLGQWDHAYPDRKSNHEDQGSGYGEEAFPATVRHDWAQDLLVWFDHYLKGTGEQPQLHAEVQDNQGFWRIHDTYPPAETKPVELTLAETTASSMDPTGTIAPEQTMTVAWDPVNDDQPLRITGMPTFHVQVTPTGPGGQLFAELRDAETGLRLGHAIMDLRYHAGGDEMQTVTPVEQITAKMQFFAMDVTVPAGHGLELHIASTGEDYLPSAVSSPVQVHMTEESVLALPSLEPTAEDYFLPPGQGDVLGDGVPDDVANGTAS